jgi:hypothetical protein
MKDAGFEVLCLFQYTQAMSLLPTMQQRSKWKYFISCSNGLFVFLSATEDYLCKGSRQGPLPLVPANGP